jgi:prepilin-type N-terminal cleavage/methylation domain-containing protein
MPSLSTKGNGKQEEPHTIRCGRSRGREVCFAFTLVELLAAMAVLSVLLLICSNIFSSSVRAWNLGATYVEQSAAVRTVLRTVATDFSMATASTSMVFRAERTGKYALPNLYGRPNSHTYDLHFVAMDGFKLTWGNPDDVTPVHYFVQPYPEDPTRYQLCYVVANWNLANLKRVYQQPAQTSLRWPARIDNFVGMPNQSLTTNITLIDNVSAFKVMVDGSDATWQSDVNAVPLHALPRFVDIYLGLLSEQNARKAALLSGPAQASFVTQNEKRFVQRVYFMNRDAVPAPTVP